MFSFAFPLPGLSLKVSAGRILSLPEDYFVCFYFFLDSEKQREKLSPQQQHYSESFPIVWCSHVVARVHNLGPHAWWSVCPTDCCMLHATCSGADRGGTQGLVHKAYMLYHISICWICFIFTCLIWVLAGKEQIGIFSQPFWSRNRHETLLMISLKTPELHKA